MQVTVDQDKCGSSGQCVPNAGDVLDQRDDDGDFVVIHDTPEQHENARAAAAAGPAAIDIEERRETLCPTP